MREVDLVPPRYHRRRRARRWLLGLIIVSTVASAGIVGIRGLLVHRVLEYGRELETFEDAHARARLDEQELQRLRDEKATVGQRLAVLSGLRGGIAAKRMFQVVDDSLDANIWFRHWNFRRAGEIVNHEPKAVTTGYFIVLPRENSDEPERTWQFHTHMEITAAAESHSALAGFVRRLSRKPEIESARILNTKVRRNSKSDAVEFELAVVVRSSQ